jgi:hypothetical protein
MNPLKYKGPLWIPALIALAVLLTIAIGALVPPVKADVLIFGSTINYDAVILPNNSYVHQGENISQGNYYDLRGVYGFSGKLGHWNNQYDAGSGEPDQIITLSGGYEFTYIDPVKFPVGKYYQWDGNYCPAGSDVCRKGFGNNNAYVFYVNPEQAAAQEVSVVKHSNITVVSGSGVMQIPVTYSETVNVTAAPTITETDIPEASHYQDAKGIEINTGVSGIAEVTPKSPGMIGIPVFAAIAAMAALRKKRQA